MYNKIKVYIIITFKKKILKKVRVSFALLTNRLKLNQG